MTTPRWKISSTRKNQLEDIFKIVKAPTLILCQLLAEQMGVTTRQVRAFACAHLLFVQHQVNTFPVLRISNLWVRLAPRKGQDLVSQ